jgi:hypothetical protein|nr:MAG TPA: hypothetical protein [Caudoviricetes sp.]
MVVNELANREHLSNMAILCQAPYGEGATTIPSDVKFVNRSRACMKWQVGENPLNRSANYLITDKDMVYSDREGGVKVLRKQRYKGKRRREYSIKCPHILLKWGVLSPIL